MLARLASTLVTRDPSIVGHATRVTMLATQLAQWLEWDDSRMRVLSIGVPLHDIGKVAVSEAILRKPGPLDPRELAEIRRHPLTGASLLDPAGFAGPAIPYVLFHHERWDGGGYPLGRAGETIPEEARLLAVVDAFDAMTSLRP